MYIAMALRSSGIDARTYLCRVPFGRIDVSLDPRPFSYAHARERKELYPRMGQRLEFEKC